MTFSVPTSASTSAPTPSTLSTSSTTTETTKPLPPSVSESSAVPTTIHQLSIPLPDAPYTRLQIHLSILQKAIMLFLTATATTNMADLGPKENGGGIEGETEPNDQEEMGIKSSGQTSRPATLAPMGSFVYAMPDPLTTPLYPNPPSTLDFATRCARVLAHRLRRPTYVGNSISEMDLGMMGATAGVKGIEVGWTDKGGSDSAGTKTGTGSGETNVLKRLVDVVIEKVLEGEGKGIQSR